MKTRSSRTAGPAAVVAHRPGDRGLAAEDVGHRGDDGIASQPAALSAVPRSAVGSGAAAPVPAIEVDEPCSSSRGTAPSDATEPEQPATSSRGTEREEGAPTPRTSRQSTPEPLRRASRPLLRCGRM